MSQVLSRPNGAQLSYGQSAVTPELIDQVNNYLHKSRAIKIRIESLSNFRLHNKYHNFLHVSAHTLSGLSDEQ